jgi:hypothetical protein
MDAARDQLIDWRTVLSSRSHLTALRRISSFHVVAVNRKRLRAYLISFPSETEPLIALIPQLTFDSRDPIRDRSHEAMAPRSGQGQVDQTGSLVSQSDWSSPFVAGWGPSWSALRFLGSFFLTPPR